MSSLLFSAKNLKMHPAFESDGFEFFQTHIMTLLNSLQLPLINLDSDLRELLRHRESTFRTSQPAHLTTSSVVLSSDGSGVLMLFHRKIAEWVYPGGHADGDWHLLRSSLRECFEETGLESVEVLPPRSLLKEENAIFCPHLFQRFEIKTTDKDPAHVHFDAVFVFRATSGDVRHDPTESEALKTYSTAEIAFHAQRGQGIVDGMDSLTARICLQAMQSAFGP
ncbi:NUDIX domain-containing protein [bacterium]|nr:NUDIX domain-containing protein [bacterium]